jgi:hypothetical protein
MHAQVKTEFGSFENLVAEVVVVDKVIDAASGTFGIRLELENRDNRVPGGRHGTNDVRPSNGLLRAASITT